MARDQLRPGLLLQAPELPGSPDSVILAIISGLYAALGTRQPAGIITLAMSALHQVVACELSPGFESECLSGPTLGLTLRPLAPHAHLLRLEDAEPLFASDRNDLAPPSLSALAVALQRRQGMRGL